MLSGENLFDIDAPGPVHTGNAGGLIVTVVVTYAAIFVYSYSV